MTFSQALKIQKIREKKNALKMAFSQAIKIKKKKNREKNCCQMHSDERVVKNPILSFLSFVIVVALSFLSARPRCWEVNKQVKSENRSNICVTGKV